MVCPRHAGSPSSSLPTGTWPCQTPRKGAPCSWLCGLPLFHHRAWHPILACSAAAQFHHSALICSALGEGSNIAHFCLLVFGAFKSPLDFILFNFLLSFVCMPSWCSWQVSEMPKSELVDLMPVQCWSWCITKTEREALWWEGWGCCLRSLRLPAQPATPASHQGGAQEKRCLSSHAPRNPSPLQLWPLPTPDHESEWRICCNLLSWTVSIWCEMWIWPGRLGLVSPSSCCVHTCCCPWILGSPSPFKPLENRLPS